LGGAGFLHFVQDDTVNTSWIHLPWNSFSHYQTCAKFPISWRTAFGGGLRRQPSFAVFLILRPCVRNCPPQSLLGLRHPWRQFLALAPVRACEISLEQLQRYPAAPPHSPKDGADVGHLSMLL
jgi:hypothetical protein